MKKLTLSSLSQSGFPRTFQAIEFGGLRFKIPSITNIRGSYNTSFIKCKLDGSDKRETVCSSLVGSPIWKSIPRKKCSIKRKCCHKTFN